LGNSEKRLKEVSKSTLSGPCPFEGHNRQTFETLKRLQLAGISWIKAIGCGRKTKYRGTKRDCRGPWRKSGGGNGTVRALGPIFYSFSRFVQVQFISGLNQKRGKRRREGARQMKNKFGIFGGGDDGLEEYGVSARAHVERSSSVPKKGGQGKGDVDSILRTVVGGSGLTYTKVRVKKRG